MGVVEKIRIAQAQNVEGGRVETGPAIKSPDEERLIFVKSQTERVLNESGITLGFARIEKEILEKTEKYHRVFFDYDSYEDYAFAELMWSDTPLPSHNYHRILVRVNLENESIAFLGKVSNEFKKWRWEKDLKLIENTLAKSYLNPEHIHN